MHEDSASAPIAAGQRPRQSFRHPHAPAAGKAALLALGRPATLHELATITKQAYHNLRNGLERCESVQRITPGTREGAGLLAVREKGTNPDPPPIQ